MRKCWPLCGIWNFPGSDTGTHTHKETAIGSKYFWLDMKDSCRFTAMSQAAWGYATVVFVPLLFCYGRAGARKILQKQDVCQWADAAKENVYLMCLSRNGVHIEMTFLWNLLRTFYLYNIGLRFVKYKLLLIAYIRYSFRVQGHDWFAPGQKTEVRCCHDLTEDTWCLLNTVSLTY